MGVLRSPQGAAFACSGAERCGPAHRTNVRPQGVCNSTHHAAYLLRQVVGKRGLRRVLRNIDHNVAPLDTVCVTAGIAAVYAKRNTNSQQKTHESRAYKTSNAGGPKLTHAAQHSDNKTHHTCQRARHTKIGRRHSHPVFSASKQRRASSLLFQPSVVFLELYCSAST